MPRRATNTLGRWTTFLILTVVLPTLAEAADSVALKAGPIIEGEITVENEQIIKIRVKNGRVMQFPRAVIEAVTYGPNSTAPSQVQQREDDSKADLKEAQETVKRIRKRRRRRRKPKEEGKIEETGQVAAQGIMADGTLIIPPQGTPEEDKWIEELRNGKNKIVACRTLAELQSLIALPDLINALDADGPILRREANTALMKITHQNFRFVYDQRSRSTRVEAIKRWRKWYEEASGKKVPWSRM